MNWRLKCFALRALDLVPFGDALYVYGQKSVTRRYWPRLSESAQNSFHVENYRKFSPGGVALEFGAGGTLMSALLMSAAGAKVYAYDINRLATLERVNHVIREFKRMSFVGSWQELDAMEELADVYDIHYVAPADIRRTGLHDGAVDFIYSTSVLEHVPEIDIDAILKELSRVSSSNAALSFSIDYHDHYATTDKVIGPCNFYRFSEHEWRKCNPPRHYQNRLRHSDFEALFSAEFSMVLNERKKADERVLQGLAIDERFSSYSVEDLLTTSGKFVLVGR